MLAEGQREVHLRFVERRGAVKCREAELPPDVLLLVFLPLLRR
ncbi:hypothetical protein [Streptomyces sp. Ncost-T10-10d]|nr:hypothetical protein [Streptomyces sp. Ncost-T10-10d]SCF56542.1 hypothetical protein GA0115254_10109 [Streptomyces sp. Ncost-T10-10d]